MSTAAAELGRPRRRSRAPRAWKTCWGVENAQSYFTERPLIKRHSLRLHDSPRCFPANCINTLQTDTFFMPSAMYQYNLMRLLDIKGNHTWVYMQLNSVQVDSPKYNTIQPYFVVFCSLSINYNLVLIRLYSSYIKVKCSQYQGYIVMLENTSQSFSIGDQCTDVWEIFPQRLFKFLTWFNNYSILTSICSAPLRRTLQASNSILLTRTCTLVKYLDHVKCYLGYS